MASRGVNKVILVGNLGQDPDTRYLPSGGAVTNITLATSETWKDKTSGQQQERTEWHRVVFFNRLGEIAGEYLRKGSKVYVEGSLRTREWEKDGVKRYSTEIVANEMQMLDSRGGDSSGGGQYQQQSSQQNAPQQQQQRSPQQSQQNNDQWEAQKAPAAPSGLDDFDDDIPF